MEKLSASVASNLRIVLLLGLTLMASGCGGTANNNSDQKTRPESSRVKYRLARQSFPAITFKLINGVDTAVLSSDAFFASGAADLSTDAKQSLKAFADGPLSEKLAPGIVVLVEGYADGVGDAAQNLALSLKRAESVRSQLRSAGTARSSLLACGRGESRARDGVSDQKWRVVKIRLVVKESSC